MSELQSVEVEAAVCRAACAGLQVGDGVGHLHHEILGERLTEPIEARIQYILRYKPQDEQARRLRAMRPWPGYADDETKRAPLDADYKAKRAALDADAHAQFCTPDCPWDGSTLFPEGVPA